MSRTFISQGQQIFNSELYSDVLAPGSALSSSAGSLEDDLNALRSIIKVHLLGSTGSVGNWYDDLTAPVSGSVIGQITGSKRGHNAINQAIYNVENKNFLYRVEVLTPVLVSGSQNFIVLAPGEAPTQTAAFDGTVSGAVVARLPGTTIGFNSLATVLGANSISPKNLVMIVTASNGQAINSPTNNGHEIFGLLQATGSLADGASLAAPNTVQLSFVTINATGDGLVAAPVADIAGKVIQYAYVARTTFTSMPEDSFISTNFTDFSSLVDLTLATAVNNQIGSFVQTPNIDWQLGGGTHFAFMTTGSAPLFRIDATPQGNTLTSQVDFFNVINNNTANFTKGASFATGSSFINVGVTAGQIDSQAGLTIKAISTLLLSGNQVTFADAFNAGSTYTGNLPLATSSGDWTSFKTEFGNVSILAAFDKLYNNIQTVSSSVATGAVGRRTASGVAVLTASIAKNVNVSTNPGHQNASGSLPSLVGVPFDSKVVVYLNGVRQYDGSANDVVPGSGLADGDLLFPNTHLKVGSIIQVDVYS